METYSAGEKRIWALQDRDLYGQLSLKTNVQVTFAEFITDVPQTDDLVEPGDLVLTQGAGRNSPASSGSHETLARLEA